MRLQSQNGTRRDRKLRPLYDTYDVLESLTDSHWSPPGLLSTILLYLRRSPPTRTSSRGIGYTVAPFSSQKYSGPVTDPPSIEVGGTFWITGAKRTLREVTVGLIDDRVSMVLGSETPFHLKFLLVPSGSLGPSSRLPSGWFRCLGRDDRRSPVPPGREGTGARDGGGKS